MFWIVASRILAWNMSRLVRTKLIKNVLIIVTKINHYSADSDLQLNNVVLNIARVFFNGNPQIHRKLPHNFGHTPSGRHTDLGGLFLWLYGIVWMWCLFWATTICCLCSPTPLTMRSSTWNKPDNSMRITMWLFGSDIKLHGSCLFSELECLSYRYMYSTNWPLAALMIIWKQCFEPIWMLYFPIHDDVDKTLCSSGTDPRFARTMLMIYQYVYTIEIYANYGQMLFSWLNTCENGHIITTHTSL